MSTMVWTWSVIFNNKDELDQFKSEFALCIYESATQISSKKIKVSFIQSSYSTPLVAICVHSLNAFELHLIMTSHPLYIIDISTQKDEMDWITSGFDTMNIEEPKGMFVTSKSSICVCN